MDKSSRAKVLQQFVDSMPEKDREITTRVGTALFLVGMFTNEQTVEALRLTANYMELALKVQGR